MSKTKIEWTNGGATWNPVVGCSPAKGSEQGGCRECYATGQVHRFGENYRSAPGLIRLGRGPRDALTFKPTDTDGKTLGKGAKWTGEVWLLPEVLAVPLRRRKPTTYFVNSLSDLFHESIVDSGEGRRFVAALFGVMAARPQHTFQVLTKRPEKAREWFAWVEKAAWAWDQVQLTPARNGSPEAPVIWRFLFEMASQVIGHDEFAALVNRTKFGDWAWPLPNVWLGTSVEDQATADARIPELLQVPASVRFLSCEPLLGPLNLETYLWHRWPEDMDRGEIDWCIAGGESGPKARPMHPDWARSLRDQCVAAGVPYFFKQWGEYKHRDPSGAPDDGGDCIRVGKKAAGRELDGRTWDEYPEVKS